jgi:hypothetical protein
MQGNLFADPGAGTGNQGHFAVEITRHLCPPSIAGEASSLASEASPQTDESFTAERAGNPETRFLRKTWFLERLRPFISFTILLAARLEKTSITSTNSSSS